MRTDKFSPEQFALQYITHQTAERSYLDGAKAALEGGCRWIQLRMKGAPDDEVRDTAEQLLPLCHERGALLLLDDRVTLVPEVGADGVHLGQKDMPIREARALLGDRYIIGGTANSLDDIRRVVTGGADYIGCGPFRFTRTKERLAPILGREGYSRLLASMAREGLQLPIVAIGGVTVDDVLDLLTTGVAGVAVSGAILTAPDPTQMTQDFITLLSSNR